MEDRVKHRARSSCLGLLVFCVWLAACASAPSQLSPIGRSAFYTMRVVRSLDMVRDIAISANAQTPPLLSTAVTRQVVEYHRSALLTMKQAPEGWKAVVSTGLEQLSTKLLPDDLKQLKPYLDLTRVLLQEVP